jgi:hypothetical protein
MDTASRIAAQSGGNIRWAILQGLGGGDGLLATELMAPDDVKTWANVLKAMEDLQQTGSCPRVWLDDSTPVWERPGGACPWALTAYMVAKRLK